MIDNPFTPWQVCADQFMAGIREKLRPHYCLHCNSTHEILTINYSATHRLSLSFQFSVAFSKVQLSRRSKLLLDHCSFDLRLCPGFHCSVETSQQFVGSLVHRDIHHINYKKGSSTCAIFDTGLVFA